MRSTAGRPLSARRCAGSWGASSGGPRARTTCGAVVKAPVARIPALVRETNQQATTRFALLRDAQALLQAVRRDVLAVVHPPEATPADVAQLALAAHAAAGAPRLRSVALWPRSAAAPAGACQRLVAHGL